MILGTLFKKILGLKYFSRFIGDDYLEITWCGMFFFMYCYVQMGDIGLMAMHVWGYHRLVNLLWPTGKLKVFFIMLGDRRGDLFTAAPQGPSAHRSSWWQFYSLKFILNVQFWFIPVMAWLVASVPISELGAIQWFLYGPHCDSLFSEI